MNQRLIDANALIQKAINASSAAFGQETLLVKLDDVLNAPTVDPVRHERWEPYKCGKYRCTGEGCETLADQYQRKLWRFCPGCGARMDGGTEEVEADGDQRQTSSGHT